MPAKRRKSEANAPAGAETAPLPTNTRRVCRGGVAPPARQGKTTLAEASRDRLAKPLSDSDLWKQFEEATGERVDPASPPTWAEMIAARQARRAVSSENGTRDAKELREAAEGGKSGSARVAFLLNLDGLPRSNAVTGET